METKELLDMTLREVLENYSVVMSLECDYIYGICSGDDGEEIYNKYDIDERVLVEMENDSGLLSLDKMCEICETLGIDKKWE